MKSRIVVDQATPRNQIEFDKFDEIADNIVENKKAYNWTNEVLRRAIADALRHEYDLGQKSPSTVY